MLTTAQKTQYMQDGFLIIENFIAKDMCKLLIRRATEIIDNDTHAKRTIFSAKDQRHAKETYFLESGDKIRLFYEENSTVENKRFSINKIGHALHDLDPVFNAFSRTHKIAALCQALEVHDPLLIQSMYICKQSFIGGEVSCHQDSTYLYVKEQPVTGLWFALENASLQNGCLWAIKGGHRAPLKSRMRRLADNEVKMDIYDNSPWNLDDMVPLEVPQGSLIVLHGLLPHMSKENISPRSRHAYTLHLMSKHHEYAQDNWLQRPTNMPFTGFF